MADSLFDIAFRGYSAPIQAEQEKARTDYLKTTNEAAKVELANQKSMQEGMQQIWGPGAGLTATDAASNPTPDMAPKLQATAALMFKTGNVKEAGSLLSSMSMASYRAAESAKVQQTTQLNKTKAVGGIVAAIDSQETYSAAIPELQEQLGDKFTSLGLTGDYQQDAPKLQMIAKSTMTAAQQTTASDKEAAYKGLNSYRNARLAQLDQGLGINMQKLNLEQQRAKDNEFMQHHKISEDAIRDQRAQEGLDMRKLGDTARQAANVAKVQKPELDAAKGVFATDDRTSTLPTNLRDTVATMAAQRTKLKLSQDMKDAPPGTTYEPEDYDSALEETMQQMDKEGLFKPSVPGGHGMFGTDPQYSHIPPKTGQGPKGPQAQGKTLPPAATAGKYDSLTSLQQAVKDKKISRDDAIALARKQGWVQ
jgi:hypothetical protein